MLWMLHEIASCLARRSVMALRFRTFSSAACPLDAFREMTDSNDDNPLLTGLAPVYDEAARVLVLGSMPGVRSLDMQAYYAHPRNAFWPIMEALFGIPRELSYQRRLAGLRAHAIALWDVIGKCRRRGSLDQKVEPDSIVPNDFDSLFSACPAIELVAFNGSLAEQSFERYVLPELPERFARKARVRLPSTSPAHASLRLEQKQAIWKGALEPVAGRAAF